MATSETIKSPFPLQKIPSAGTSISSNEKNETTTTTTASTTISSKGRPVPKAPDEFYKDLYQFHERRGTPIAHMPKISGRAVDLYGLYNEVTERGGFVKVNIRDEWDEVAPLVGFREKCLNATAAIKQIYRRFLDKYERLNFLGEDPDKMEALEASDTLEIGRSGRARYPSLHSSTNLNLSALNTVPMSYNYRQHIVNIERRRLNKLSTDLHKASPYEKLLLSLLSPLPNEQDFAINVCTLMSNESKHTLKLNEFPKLLDILLAHAGVFSDYTLRKLFQQVYADVRKNSLYAFWRDLLYDKPQILDLYSDEQIIKDATLADGEFNLDEVKPLVSPKLEEYLNDSFLNLGRAEGTQDYVGQRVQQIAAILRNLSFFEENLTVFAKNRTFLRFVVMASNIRWGNIHMQALDVAGNVATEIELLDPTTDDLSRSLMATIVDGIEGMDRAVILNCLEILYKISQKDSNEDHINRCLNLKFYETICLFLSLNDIMLLIYTLETIYSLTSLGTRSCHLLMQVRGVIDQLVALITVEAQSYGPDGCILMRVVETVPGNMLPMVAQNIANLQNVAVKQQIQQHTPMPQIFAPSIIPQQPVAQIVHQPEHLQQKPIQVLSGVQIPQPQPPLAPETIKATLVQQQKPLQPQPQPQQQQPQTQIQQQPTPPTTLSNPQVINPPLTQNSTHEDEQCAMAWLGASFERAATADCRIEQQELYRMYVTHCQKLGKLSVVSHLQFPRLVRLIYNQSVGPMVVRGSDGLDLPGFHYVGIRVRSQPLPIQSKLQNIQPKPETPSPMRKIKKKLKPQPIPQQEQSNEAISSSSESAKFHQAGESAESTQVKELLAVGEQQVESGDNANVTNTPDIEQSIDTPQTSAQTPSSTSLIKTLLANKVTQRQQKQKDLATTTVASVPTVVAQSQPALASQQQQQPQPIKVTSTAISALVNNPLMQNTPVKVGQTTIKPLGLAQHVEKKPILESTPPPLAPLSGGNVAKDANGRPIIISTTSNPMLMEIIDKKTHPLDPSHIPATIIKRKLENDTPPPLTTKRLALDDTPVTPSKNAANLYAEFAAALFEDEEMDDLPISTATTATVTTTNTTRTILEQPQQQLVRIQQPVATVATVPQAVTLPTTVQRQLIIPSQLKPTLTSQPQQIPTAMATIKTDQGLQTVPVILQQKQLDGSQILQSPHTQYVLATNPQGQTYLVAQQTSSPAPPPPPTPPPPTQTVLVTQTPQQQSTGAKTIIILQQQSAPNAPTQQIITTGGGVGGQKMIMTTPQGQQVLVTQRPHNTTTPTPQQIFINPQTGTATHIQHIPPVTLVTASMPSAAPSTTFQRQIIQATVPHQQPQQQQHTGQISPTLLSQLNHIPATIKLHQPQPPQQPQQPQPATISRIGKPMTIAVSQASSTTQIQIPQLHQHQSIIQQHIVSGPSEKRQMILGGGRAIEIKETIITQAQPPPQISQLNSQTIITTQQQQQQQQLPSITKNTQQQIQQGVNVITTTQKIVETPSLISTATIGKMQTVLPQTVHTSTMKKTSIVPMSANAQQQIKIQGSATTPTAIAPKPVLSSGPPPLAAVSQNQVTKPQLETSAIATTTTMKTETKNNDPISAIAGTSISSASLSSTTSSTVDANPAITESKLLVPTTTISQPTLPSLPSLPQPSLPHPQLPHPSLPTVVIPPIDPNWLYICDWRNCPRRKYKSLADLQYHVTVVHCPDHLDISAEIFCQWGASPLLCDGVPRKRFSLMTHLIDRHLTVESLRSACQRRIATGSVNIQPSQPPVTIMRNIDKVQHGNTSSPSSSSAATSQAKGCSALHAIKRHTADFINPKELMDENEGPVTKSIRLTAALILRNLVTYTSTAKRSLRHYEPHLANIALSNVESSGALSHILAELHT